MFNDEIVNRTTISFSFADRLRILVGRKVSVTVNIKTESVVGNTETESSVAVDRFRVPRVQIGAGDMETFEEAVAVVHRNKIRIALHEYCGLIVMSAFVLTGIGLLYGWWAIGA
jgi:hypothetical protein